MSRPQKKRRVCCQPQIKAFSPVGCQHKGAVSMSVDEYEAIRLIDLEGLNQDECAAQMQVSRSTVQLVYNRARKKIASSLVQGYTLNIDGGDYTLCNECRGACHQCCKRK